MKKISFLLLLNVFTAGLCLAQKPQSVLWEISGKGLKQKSYLLGTIHTVPKEIIDKFPILKQVINKSSIGIFENVDGEGIGPVPELAQEPPLDSIFSPADYAVVDSFFVKHGYGSIKDHNNDASLYGMIQVALVSKAAKKTDAQYTLDSYLQDPFRNAHKTCYGLDEAKLVDEQMKAISKSPQKQADYLVAIIKGDAQAPSIEKMVHMDLYTAYLKNYVYEDQNFSTQNKDYAAIMKVAFERNQLWLPKIEDHMAKQSCFIAVGFGHLQYKTGLIAMLKKQGYKLKPINYNDKL